MTYGPIAGGLYGVNQEALLKTDGLIPEDELRASFERTERYERALLRDAESPQEYDDDELEQLQDAADERALDTYMEERTHR